MTSGKKKARMMHVSRLSNRKTTIEAVKQVTGAIFMGFEEKIKA
jgi:hypothetical protein